MTITSPLASRSFNPCFNGILSSIAMPTRIEEKEKCFNPCFNGILSSIYMGWLLPWSNCRVSILVLMESFLQSEQSGRRWKRSRVSILVLMESFLQSTLVMAKEVTLTVSILVLMESFLQWSPHIAVTSHETSFNPCFNGILSSITMVFLAPPCALLFQSLF